VVDGAAAWAEDAWVGRRLRVGGTAVRVAKACDRCLVTTIDQDTADKGRQPLRALGVHRNFAGGLRFGVNLIPDAAAGDTGVIRVGDSIELLP
jgi:uncharacterized protein